ncbi:hypothetical protein P7K49_009761 [Saguinus oedipus]|uniref:Uncharacterized protein n=1 Tax=Saguinus oedipus TaxID=9490 RepID=A0ABQ9VKW4_SAGOE|nr:hypothetical protein P7K49_009761 [Saguinus oedipus]
MPEGNREGPTLSIMQGNNPPVVRMGLAESEGSSWGHHLDRHQLCPVGKAPFQLVHLQVWDCGAFPGKAVDSDLTSAQGLRTAQLPALQPLPPFPPGMAQHAFAVYRRTSSLFGNSAF